MRLADRTQNEIQCELSKEEIEKDIEVYRKRLDRAGAKLNELPRKLMGRKLRERRQALISEIQHVQQLIEYATDALSEMAD